MKKQQTIKLSLSKYPRRERLTLSPDWISNGFWAVKRRYVANTHLIDADATVRPDAYRQLAPEVARVVTPPTDSVTFSAVSECHLQAKGNFLRVFTSVDGTRAGFNFDYLQLFAPIIGKHPTCEMASPRHAGFFAGPDGDIAVVIMPMNLDHAEGFGGAY